MAQVPTAADKGFEAAVVANTRRLIGLARAMLGGSLRDAKEPEDLVQDALLRLFRQRENYDWSDGGWSLMAKSVARNVISCRRRKVGQTLDGDDGLMESLGEDMDPARASMHAETTALLRQRIDALPENWRKALILREQQEMAYKEIADMLSATEAQVKTWLHRARARLAGQLQADERAPVRPQNETQRLGGAL